MTSTCLSALYFGCNPKSVRCTLEPIHPGDFHARILSKVRIVGIASIPISHSGYLLSAVFNLSGSLQNMLATHLYLMVWRLCNRAEAQTPPSLSQTPVAASQACRSIAALRLLHHFFAHKHKLSSPVVPRSAPQWMMPRVYRHIGECDRLNRYGAHLQPLP